MRQEHEVVKVARECREVIDACQRVDALAQDGWAQDRLVDFNHWAAGIGLFANSKNALHHRLRDHQQVLSIVVAILRMLAATFQAVTEAASHSETQADAAGDNVEPEVVDDEEVPLSFSPWTSDEDDSDRESGHGKASIISKERLSTHTREIQTSVLALDRHRRDAETLLTRLIELGVLIRRAGRASRLMRADSSFREERYLELRRLLQLTLGLSNLSSLTADAPDNLREKHHFYLKTIIEYENLNTETDVPCDMPGNSEPQSQTAGNLEIYLLGRVGFSALPHEEAYKLISERFPDIDLYKESSRKLLLRKDQYILVTENLKRRHRFEFARKRARQLSRSDTTVDATVALDEGIDETHQPQQLERSKGSENVYQVEKIEHTGSQNESISIAQTVSAIDENALKALQVVDEVSNVHKPFLDHVMNMSAAQSVSTAMTRITSTISYPAPPAISKSRRKTFRCPCCFEDVPKKIAASSQRWKKHLARDLYPYTCIIPGCKAPTTVFVKKNEWLNHLESSHTTTSHWVCPICAKEAIFKDPAYLEAHLQMEHKDSISARAMATMVDFAGRTSLDLPESCPVCNFPEGGMTRDVYLDHLAICVHNFSLTALPWNDEPPAGPRLQPEMSAKIVSWCSEMLSYSDITVPEDIEDTMTSEKLITPESLRRPLPADVYFEQVSESKSDNHVALGRPDSSKSITIASSASPEGVDAQSAIFGSMSVIMVMGSSESGKAELFDHFASPGGSDSADIPDSVIPYCMRYFELNGTLSPAYVAIPTHDSRMENFDTILHNRDFLVAQRLLEIPLKLVIHIYDVSKSSEAERLSLSLTKALVGTDYDSRICVVTVGWTQFQLENRAEMQSYHAVLSEEIKTTPEGREPIEIFQLPRTTEAAQSLLLKIAQGSKHVLDLSGTLFVSSHDHGSRGYTRTRSYEDRTMEDVGIIVQRHRRRLDDLAADDVAMQQLRRPAQRPPLIRIDGEEVEARAYIEAAARLQNELSDPATESRITSIIKNLYENNPKGTTAVEILNIFGQTLASKIAMRIEVSQTRSEVAQYSSPVEDRVLPSSRNEDGNRAALAIGQSRRRLYGKLPRNSLVSIYSETIEDEKSGNGWASSVNDPWWPLFLTLDGGGIRSFGSLLILQALMHEVWVWENHYAGLDDEADNRAGEGPSVSTKFPKTVEELLPCHYFDFMFGTSTGGIIATLLGRLRMTVPQARSALFRIYHGMFAKTRSRIPLITAKYYSSAVREALEFVVSSSEGSAGLGRPSKVLHALHALHVDDDGIASKGVFQVEGPRVCQSCCLVAKTDDSPAEAYLLRTYDIWYDEYTPNWVTRYNEGAEVVSAVDAMMATSATPGFFDNVHVEHNGVESIYRDGGIKENNPSGVAFSEFHTMYAGIAPHPALLLSIGTGKRKDEMPWSIMQTANRRAVKMKYSESEYQHTAMRTAAHGEYTWYKRLSPEHLENLADDEYNNGEWHGTKLAGGATFTRVEQAVERMMQRDFDIQTDSYAPPKVMLKQAAQKLVLQRRAREQEGGERWRKFCSEGLQSKYEAKTR